MANDAAQASAKNDELINADLVRKWLASGLGWLLVFPTIGALVSTKFTYPEFLDWRSRSKTLGDMAAEIGMAQRMVKTPDGAAGLWGSAVSSNAFEVLKAGAMLGRTIGPQDEGNPDVVVLSHDVWRLHFRSDASIVGKTIELRTGALLAPIPPRVLTVIGVMPPDFQFPTGARDFFTLFVPNPSQPTAVTLIAALADGASLDAATQEAELIGAAIRGPWPAAATRSSRPGLT